MSDLIKRETVLAFVRRCKDRLQGKGLTYDILVDYIESIPSADLNSEFSEWARHWFKDSAERKGEWIRTGRTNIYGGIEVQCSNCGDKVMVQHLEDEWYCRHCGADMGMKGADDE